MDKRSHPAAAADNTVKAAQPGISSKSYRDKPSNQVIKSAPNTWAKDQVKLSQKRVAVLRHLPKPTKLHDYSHIKVSSVYPVDTAKYGRETASIEAITQSRICVSTRA